jgi:hypothetical protein
VSYFSNSFSITVGIESNPFSISVFEAGAGKAKKRRRRYTVVIDNQEFSVSSIAEAEALLTRAKQLASDTAQQVVERSAKRVERGEQALEVYVPVIKTAAPELQSLVSSYRDDIEAIYRQSAIDAEIAELLRARWQRELEDDEDAALILLLDSDDNAKRFIEALQPVLSHHKREPKPRKVSKRELDKDEDDAITILLLH